MVMQVGLKILQGINNLKSQSKFFCKITTPNSGDFSKDLFKAIEEFKIRDMERQTAKKQYKSRYNGRSKKRQWQNYDGELSEAAKEKRANFNPEDRVKRKKTVILMGYSGANYFGMQRNPGQKTIEEDLFQAMLTCKWIDEEGFNQAQQIHFQRAARTDKGVSAARQICSVKLPEELDLTAINTELPEQIRVFATKRVTKGFNCKDQCNARTYTYTMPSIALDAEVDQQEMELYRINESKVENLRNVLKMYEGTKNYHNFTSKKEFLDPSSKRYIMNFDCDEPFVCNNGVQFITCRVKGQSFMLHQIRKMIGLALAIVRGNTTEETLQRSFEAQRIDIPMAPGLGLVLDQVHYDRYNEKYGSDGIHETLTWDKEEQEIQTFIDKYIFPTIFETEIKDRPMLKWIETLSLHTYDERQSEESKTDAAISETQDHSSDTEHADSNKPNLEETQTSTLNTKTL